MKKLIFGFFNPTQDCQRRHGRRAIFPAPAVRGRILSWPHPALTRHPPRRSGAGDQCWNKVTILVTLYSILFTSVAFADEVTDEIKARFNVSLGKAQPFCQSLPEKINNLKILSGVSGVSGAVGAASGGVAIYSGFSKQKIDADIAEQEKIINEAQAEIEKNSGPVAISTNAKVSLELTALQDKFVETPDNVVEADIASVFNLVDSWKNVDQSAKEAIMAEVSEYPGRVSARQTALGNANAAIADANEKLAGLREQSKVMGNVRTGTNFGAGVVQGGAVAVNLIGVAQIDEIVTNMNACDTYIREIEQQRNELLFAAPDDPDIARMGNIFESCKGMSSKNIADVKAKLRTAGIISAVGAGIGVAGGVTSAIAVSKEQGKATDGENQAVASASASKTAKEGGTKELNIASNVLAIGTTATAVATAVISGVTLSGLVKNGEIAEKCASVF